MIATAKEYPLQRLDPLSKLVSLFSIAILAMHWDRPLPLIIMLPVLLAAGRYGAGMTWRRLAKRMAYIAAFGLPLLLLTALAAPPEGTAFELGPIRLYEGPVAYAGAITLRMFCLFLSSLIYIESTDPQDFVVMMTTRLKLPYRFAFGVSMALTFLPMLEAEGRSAAEARKIRYGRRPRGFGERLEVWRGNVTAVFAGAVRRIEQTAGSMEAKGFGAYRNRTFLREARVSAGGYAVMLLSVTSMALLMWTS
ncbi:MULTISPECIES: energy-coupling factor transporter transmembrane component T [Paenibacillus]|uniref:energy-coupling factor transporter transmembrane component T family protein n=1 Tax=Paenibacillus TaxID=44249 RepID=UPI002FDF1208